VAERRYLKIPFELGGDASPRPIELPAGLAFERVTRQTIVSIMSEALATSLDPADVDAVHAHGAMLAAERLLDLASDGFEWQQEWWEAITIDGARAGCVLPVIFSDSRRDGRDEGTIFHMGVVPAFRGRGIGALLLARGTNTLLGHGVWRIYCDTAATNDPMIAAFMRQGWTRHAPHQAGYWG